METNLQKPAILIVDDNEVSRDMLANLFSEMYAIEMAENGEEGLKKVRDQKNPVCAILLDVKMPVMDGVTMLKILHGENLTKSIPVFLITGEATPEIIREAYQLGVMDVIPKPGMNNEEDGITFPFIVKRRVNSIIELFMARTRLAGIVDQQRDTILQLLQAMA